MKEIQKQNKDYVFRLYKKKHIHLRESGVGQSLIKYILENIGRKLKFYMEEEISSSIIVF